MTAGRELGDLRLGRRLAVGGMAEIFEAVRNDGRGPPLVVKLLLPHYAKDPEVVRMLAHEGELMRGLAHPALVRVLEVVTEGEPHLVLERVDGVSLDVLVDALSIRKSNCTLEMALAIALPLLDALAYVHEATDPRSGERLSIVHRDVTPHNVLVARDGTIKLGDFGIARSSLRDARTRTGIVRGKLRYLAPEQVTGSDVDARTDLYAVGVMIWELLAGAAYLDADGDVELLRRAEQPRFRPIPGGDPRLEPILKKALAPFVEQRHRDARALGAALAPLASEEALARGRAAWAALVEAEGAPPVPAPIRARPASSWLGVAAVGLAAAAGIAAWVATSRDDAAPRAPSIAEPVPAPTDAGAARAEPTPAPDAGADAGSIALAVTPPAPPRRRELGPTASPAEPPAPSEPVPPAPEPVDAHAAELAALRRELAARGVLASDLDAPTREAIRGVEEALAAGEAATARARLDAVAPMLRAIRVDEAFVRAKLERVDARIRAARAAGADTAEIERLSALALQDLLEHRPEATNRRLNQILRRLAP